MEDLSRRVAAELLSLVGPRQEHWSTLHHLIPTMLRHDPVETLSLLPVPVLALIVSFNRGQSPDTGPKVPHQGSPETTMSCDLAV